MAETKIGNYEFKAEKLPAKEATRNLLRLAKLIGPAFQKLPEALAAEKGSKQDALALDAISDLLSAADPIELTDFIVELAETAKVKNQNGNYDSVVFDLHCTGPADGLLLAVLVLRVNYTDFFKGKLGNVLRAAAPAA